MAVAFDTPIHTSDQSIERVIQAGLPVVLVFHDEGAQPLDATLERLARDHAGQLLIARLRMRDNPASARRFQVSRTPALVTLRAGQPLTRLDGATPADVDRHVAYLLGRGPRPEAPSHPAPASPAQTTAGTSPARDRPLVVTDATFDHEVLQAAEPVLVDFWAVWCGPCRLVEPTVEKLAGELSGKLRVAKVNVDENPLIAQRFGVQSIPTMMIVRGGKIIDRWAGALPENALRARVAAVLGGA